MARGKIYLEVKVDGRRVRRWRICDTRQELRNKGVRWDKKWCKYSRRW
jgi:hypothetical protein